MFQTMKLPQKNTSKYSLIDTKVDLESFNVCPYCNKSISPRFIYGYFSHDESPIDISTVADNAQVYAIYECPDCHNGILVTYNVSYTKSKSGSIQNWNTFTIKSIVPTPNATFDFDKTISDMSPRFKTIYLQSLQAKLDGKDELVGIGYRKALEFLIKDYLIDVKHENVETISDKPLSQCIQMIDNPKISNLAKATTWLGNDETHYVRKHNDKDIQDLEKFLKALVYYLSYELTYEEASTFIGE